MSEKRTAKSELIHSVKGASVSIIIVLLLLSGIVLLLPESEFLQNHVKTAGKGILLIAAFTGGTVCRKNAQMQKLLYAELAGAILMVALLVIGIATGAGISGTSAVMDILLIAFGSFASIILPEKRRSRHKREEKYRT